MRNYTRYCLLTVFLVLEIGLLGMDGHAQKINKKGPGQLPINYAEQITSDTDSLLYADISSDGKWIAYVQFREGMPDLWLKSIDSSTGFIPRRLTRDPAGESSPSFSRNAQFLAYESTRDDVKGDIYLLDLKSKNSKPIRLTGRETEEGSPCFSSDGHTLYFHQAKTGQRYREIVSLSLSQPIKIKRVKEYGAFPSVSPDGKHLCFVSHQKDPSGDICILNIKTGETKPLTDGEDMDFFPRWYGNSIFFSRFAVDTNQDGVVSTQDNAAIYKVNVKENRLACPLTSAAYSSFMPCISGEKLFFLSNRGGIINCWALPLDGEIPGLDLAENQFQQAEDIALKIPFDPYLSVLAYYKVLDKFPKNASICAKSSFYIAKIYQKINMPGSARAAFQRTMEMGLAPWKSLSLIEETIMQVHHKTLSLDHALAKLQDIAKGKSSQVQVRAILEHARVLINSGNGSAGLLNALKQLDSLIQSSASDRTISAEAMILKADIYRSLGMPEKVYPVYLSVLDDYPDISACADKAVHRIIELAISGFGKENLEEQVQSLRDMAQENRKTHPILAAGALNRLGDLYFASDDWLNAKRAYRQVLEQFPNASSQIAGARLSLAEILYREERFRQALDLYEKEIDARSYEDRIYHLARKGYIQKSISAGEFLYRLGEIASARNKFKEIMEYDDSIIEAHRGYIKCAAAVGEIKQVLSNYQARLKQDPNDAIALYTNGLCLTYLEDKASLTRAKELLLQAIQRKGQIEYFHQTLGYVFEVFEVIYQEKGNLEKALAAYQKAYFLNDHQNNAENAGNLLLNLGNIYYLLGQYTKAFQYYTQQLEEKTPFDHSDTEILFYCRFGTSAFHAKDTEKTIFAFNKILDLINIQLDPQRASHFLDRMNHYIMDQIVSPAFKIPDLRKKAKKLAKRQSQINQTLSEISNADVSPPSAEWNAYQKGIEDLITKQEKVNQDALDLENQTRDLKAQTKKSQAAKQTLFALTRQVRESLRIPEQRIQLKAEILDRLGLAYQHAEHWEKAIHAFQQALKLNQELGLYPNLSRNQRSIAYNTYKMAALFTGTRREELLKSSAKDFTQVIQWVKTYGVPERKKEKGKGLINISAQISLDQSRMTEAAYGFSSAQEIRLAEAFLTQIHIELGDFISAEKAINTQLAQYPMGKTVPEKDIYGVSLLYHRAGHLAYRMRKLEPAFDYFRYSAELCLSMKNPVSAMINVSNMAKVRLNIGDRKLKDFDQLVTRLLEKNSAVLDRFVRPIYHNKMGVYALTESREYGAEELLQAVFKMNALEDAVRHFTEGIEWLEKARGYTKKDLELLATLHLNMAQTALELREKNQSEAHFKSALEYSIQGNFSNLQWRALAGLGQLDEALDILENIMVWNAGCEPGEITSSFGQMVLDLVNANKIEDAFNLSEYLSELERFHRMAFFVREISESEKKLYPKLYSKLERIQDLRKKLGSAKGEEKKYIQDNLNQELKFLHSKIGKDMSDVVRIAGDQESRENVMLLLGLCIHAVEIKDQASKRKAFETYRQALEKARSKRPADVAADIFTLFGPEAFEAIDVMEHLSENETFIRVFYTGYKYILFTLTPDDITGEIVTEDWKSKIKNHPFLTLAIENPLECLDTRFSYVFSGTHFVRAVMNRKPFKQSATILPRKFDHQCIANLSLAILPRASLKEDAYFLGHLFSIYGCPSLILPEHPVTESSPFIPAFLKNYSQSTVLESVNRASQDNQPKWIQLGYRGMTLAQAKIFAQRNFEKYVRTGMNAFKLENYEEALSLFENAIWIAKQTPHFQAYLSSIYFYARESAYQTGQLKKSLDHAKEQVKCLTEEQPDTEKHAKAMLTLGQLHAKLEQYEKAIPILQEAVEILANLEAMSLQASALAEFGVVLENAAAYNDALLQFQSAASLSHRLNKTALVAAQYANIGRLYDLRLSQYALGIKNYQKALVLYQEMNQSDKTAQSLLDIGRCYRLLGNFIAADKHYQDAFKLVSSKDLRLKTKILIEQANNAWYQARYQDAFQLERKAYRMAKENDLPLMEVVSLNTSGLLWCTLGDHAKAMKELQKALEHAQKLKVRDDEVATTLNNMGLVYREMGRYKEALSALEKAIEIDTKLNSRWALAYDFRNKALTFLKMKKTKEAIPLFVKTVSQAQDIGNRINESKSLVGLANAYLELKNLSKAEKAFQNALDLSQAMSIREMEWRSLYGLAKIKLIQKNVKDAKTLLFKTIEVIENIRSEIKINQLKDSFIVNKLEVYQTLVKLLADTGDSVKSFEIAERSRARNFIDLLGNQRISLSRNIDQELYDHHRRLKARIAEHEILLAQASDKTERDMYAQRLMELRREFEMLMLDIQAENPHLASLVSVEPVHAKSLFERIEPDIALLAYYVLPEEIFCWIIQSKDMQLIRIPIKQGILEQKILEYRRMIQNLEPLDDQSHELFQWLVEPVISRVKHAKVLGIIPHGSLHYLSFATLSDDQGYLIERFPLFYLPSASLLTYTLEKRVPQKNVKVLAVGNPDLGKDALDLPFAEHEVNSVKWNFPNITILTREKASESWVVRHIEQFGMIYMASHGEFNPVNPLFSAIKLSKDKDRDGDLEAAEIFGLKINADMVVLSACQTGLAKVTQGDDVIGLNRAFFYAGSHTIISSLWRVSDISTAMLMKQFYRAYLMHHKAESLRLAMLHVMQRYSHPGYWGAFTLSGDYY